MEKRAHGTLLPLKVQIFSESSECTEGHIQIYCLPWMHSQACESREGSSGLDQNSVPR